ncbi:hypothetical protein C5746_33345 [Streptomyces atratus]|uniref:Uncharacterized protein n=1 Tax=Streptomyces atratus TaxID=1893 RepID=A0A2Z5JLF0_STRAR|nr:hypothetical protein C5746_33345 [Streptomyces atratus]
MRSQQRSLTTPRNFPSLRHWWQVAASNLSATAPVEDLVRWAKMRWRIEHDYRGHSQPNPGHPPGPVEVLDRCLHPCGQGDALLGSELPGFVGCVCAVSRFDGGDDVGSPRGRPGVPGRPHGRPPLVAQPLRPWSRAVACPAGRPAAARYRGAAGRGRWRDRHL